jgi:hypothetical protein
VFARVEEVARTAREGGSVSGPLIRNIDDLIASGKLEARLNDLVNTYSLDFPLERCCEQGGWPPDDGIDLSVRSVTLDGDYYQIRVAVALDEIVPTSCGDIQMSNSVYGEMELTVDRQTGKVEFHTGDE